MEHLTDAQILSRCGDDPSSFALLIERHHAGLHRYAARRVGADEADDIVAETFTAAYRRRDRFDGRRPDARAWLFGIATNLLRDHRRTESARLRAYARRGVDPVAADDAPRDPMGPEVAAALAALRPRHRDVLFLHAVAELSHEEIAEAMDVPVATVRSWLHRARDRARRELAPRAAAPPATRTEAAG
ncbi:MAG: RNA polymerase sigma factor [Thermoleophilia bacterium]